MCSFRHPETPFEKEVYEVVRNPLVLERAPSGAVLLDFDEAIRGSDCPALATKDDQYPSLDLTRVKSLMRTLVVVDGRNALIQKKVEGVASSAGQSGTQVPREGAE